MKKTASLLLALLLAASVCACQPALESPVVVEKDIDRMVAQAAAESQAQAAVIAPLEAPARYQKTRVHGEHNVTTAIDARVSLPQVSAMPVVRVEAADFSQETAQQFFNALCNGARMVDTAGRRTKAELEESIQSWISLRDSEDYADDPDGQREINDQIAAEQKESESAPETREDFVVDGTLYNIPVADTKGNRVSEYLGISAQDEVRGMHFTIRNNNGLAAPIIYEYGTGWSGLEAGSRAVMLFMRDDLLYPSGEGQWYSEPIIPITDESAVPDEACGRLQTTPAQARKMLETLLADTDMRIHSISLASNYCEWRESATHTKETGSFGYNLLCTRMVRGVPVALTGGITNAQDRYAAGWAYEYMDVLITDDGIADLYWSSPHTVGETVVEQAQLLPFAEVIAILEKMLAVSYPKPAYYGSSVTHTTVRVERMELALQRVSEASNVKNGLYIPVWSCYGTFRNELANGKYHDTAEEGHVQFPECLLTINAIDGSIIDLEKGY